MRLPPRLIVDEGGTLRVLLDAFIKLILCRQPPRDLHRGVAQELLRTIGATIVGLHHEVLVLAQFPVNFVNELTQSLRLQSLPESLVLLQQELELLLDDSPGTKFNEKGFNLCIVMIDCGSEGSTQ